MNATSIINSPENLIETGTLVQKDYNYGIVTEVVPEYGGMNAFCRVTILTNHSIGKATAWDLKDCKVFQGTIILKQ